MIKLAFPVFMVINKPDYSSQASFCLISPVYFVDIAKYRSRHNRYSGSQLDEVQNPRISGQSGTGKSRIAVLN